MKAVDEIVRALGTKKARF